MAEPTTSAAPPSRATGGLRFTMAALLLAVVAALLLAAAGFGTRLGLWHFRTGFTLLEYGAYCGGAAFLAALPAALFALRARRYPALVVAATAALAGLLLAAVPVTWKLNAQRLPRIHDITTDITNPPLFVAIVPLRMEAPNPATYGGPEVAALQRKAYPDIKTVVLELPQPQAFETALAAARSMGWQIVTAVPPERIEATDTTFWFGFKDDIVIRVAPAANRSLVDIRSVSRVGVSDVGTNARRIRAFVKKLAG